MEIVAQKVSTIDIRFIQDLDGEIDEVTPFVKSLKKIISHINSPGFSNKYTKAEKAIWNELSESLLDRVE